MGLGGVAWHFRSRFHLRRKREEGCFHRLTKVSGLWSCFEGSAPQLEYYPLPDDFLSVPIKHEELNTHPEGQSEGSEPSVHFPVLRSRLAACHLRSRHPLPVPLQFRQPDQF